MGKPVQTNDIPSHPQVLIKPFEKWALERFGPIIPMYIKKRYILVCIDYTSKWVEDKTLLKSNEQFVVYFLYEDIFTQFGVPRKVVTD
jgi:hypothetical protein